MTLVAKSKRMWLTVFEGPLQPGESARFRSWPSPVAWLPALRKGTPRKGPSGLGPRKCPAWAG